MDVSVVVATRDRRHALTRTLDSLRMQSGAPAFEIIVVDNGSSDETRDVVDAHAARGLPVRYVWEAAPNRGKARNRGVDAAAGTYVLFCDDDVWAPPHWIAAHAAAQAGRELVVSGPILNVPSYESRRRPTLANYSRAFLCTCNASLSRRAFADAGGFDESFDLYGWEDTELGVRLRQAGAIWKFSWEAYILHVKPPAENTLEVEARKAVEKARMAGRFLAKHPSRRARLATGAHRLNLLRARYFLPDPLLALYAGLSTSGGVPAWLRGASRSQLLDALYARELVRVVDAADAR